MILSIVEGGRVKGVRVRMRNDDGKVDSTERKKIIGIEIKIENSQ
jgi:hypothetical protein